MHRELAVVSQGNEIYTLLMHQRRIFCFDFIYVVLLFCLFFSILLGFLIFNYLYIQETCIKLHAIIPNPIISCTL